MCTHIVGPGHTETYRRIITVIALSPVCSAHRCSRRDRINGMVWSVRQHGASGVLIIRLRFTGRMTMADFRSQALTYDDVLLVPKRSDVASRKHVSTST